MVEDLASPRARMTDEQGDDAALRAYLRGLLSAFSPATPEAPAHDVEESGLPDRVFTTLTSRDFCYLSKSRAAVYRCNILTEVRGALDRREPIRFYYDIGGGYHASLDPGTADLMFDMGLAELFVLRQISDFSARIRRFYRPGAKVSLVIDNLCAYLVNDIPLARTSEYCQSLRHLIRGLGLESLVDVLVESEHVSLADFPRQGAESNGGPPPAAVTSKQHHNVERFLGRPCEADEAAERTRRYETVLEASERLLASLIRGIHMTQRATADTICFRPFPGGDSRIQCGEVALTRNGHGKLCPVLLTSANFREYTVQRYRFADILPSGIAEVTYARRLADQRVAVR